MYIYMYVYVYLCMCMYTLMHVSIYTCIHIHVGTHTHIYVHISAYTCIHLYIHMHRSYHLYEWKVTELWMRACRTPSPKLPLLAYRPEMEESQYVRPRTCHSVDCWEFSVGSFSESWATIIRFLLTLLGSNILLIIDCLAGRGYPLITIQELCTRLYYWLWSWVSFCFERFFSTILLHMCPTRVQFLHVWAGY